MQYTFYILPLLFSVSLLTIFFIYSWQFKEAPSARPLSIALLLGAFWSLASVMEFGSPDLAEKLAWIKFRSIASSMLTVFWFAMVLGHTGWRRALDWRFWAAIAFLPLVSIPIILTLDRHSFYFVSYGLKAAGSFWIFQFQPGPWFWILTFYSYLLTTSSLLLLVLSLRQAQPIYFRQTLSLIFATLLPSVVELLFRVGISPAPGFNLTPVAFVVTVPLLFWALFRYRLLDVVSFAHAQVVESMRDLMFVLDARDRVVGCNPSALRFFGWDAVQVIGMPVNTALQGFPEILEKTRSGESEVELPATPNPAAYELSVTPLLNRSNYLNGRVVILHEITERKQAETALQSINASLEYEVKQRTTLYQIASMINTLEDLQTTCSRTLQCLLSALDAQAGGIFLLEDGCGELTNVALIGLPEETLEIVAAWPAWRKVIEEQRPVQLADFLGSSPVQAFNIFFPYRSFGGVPIFEQGRIQGVLGVLGQDEAWLQGDELTLLAAVADQLGLAIENFRLRNQAQEAAVIQDRQRLSRDLHDSVSQLLYGQMLFADAGRKYAARGSLDQTIYYLDRLAETAVQALREMRLLIYNLKPVEIQNEGLVGVLQRRLDTVENRSGIESHLIANLDVCLPAPVQEGLYWIAQEALNNVLKHSSASKVILSLQAGEDGVELEIADNGKGFDPQAIKEGLGLASLRDRARQLGGSLTIVSQPGQGARLKVEGRWS